MDKQAEVGVTAAWNTGRLYTQYGQRIAAQVVGDTVAFTDYDRNIDGIIQLNGQVIWNARELQQVTMLAYDHGRYDSYIADRELRKSLIESASMCEEARNRVS